MDAARTAARLGAEPLIIYRRTREQMPAHDFEADEAIEEGVKIHWLRTIKEIDGTTLTVEVMRARRKSPSGADRRVRDARSRFADSRPRARHRHDVPEERPRHRVHRATEPWSWGATCRLAAPACSQAATWCRTRARSQPPLVTERRRRGTSTPGSWRGAVEADEARNRNVRDAAALVSRRGETARPEHD